MGQARRSGRVSLAGRRRSRGPARRALDRLGDVAVHAGRQAALAVALHGVGGHGDDRQCRPPAARSRRRGSAASPRSRPSPASARPSAPGRTAPPPARPAPRGRRRRTTTVCPCFSRSRRGELLVDGVVLGEQDAQRRRRSAAGRRLAGRRPRPRAGRGGRRVARWPSSRSDWLDRLGRGTRPMPERRGSGPRPRWPVAPDESIMIDRPRRARPASRGSLGQREAVHLRHHRVEQDQRERPPAARGACSSARRRRPPSTERRAHPPAAQHLVEDAAVGRVVVDDQDRQPAQVRRGVRASGSVAAAARRTRRSAAVK